MRIEGKTATEVMKKAIDYCYKYGEIRQVWGGTIPADIKDPDSPNDFDREMIELPPGFTMVLTNPLANWTDYSDHWVGITLREQEDHFQRYNPGHVIKYSSLYNCWLKNNFFNYTYGERLCAYPYNIDEVSGKYKKRTSDFDQIDRAIKLLKQNPSSRKVCISTWHPVSDLGNNYTPCNMIFQLRVIDNKLEWVTVVRSLDLLRGLSENIFQFTMYQQFVANKLNVAVGKYTTVALNAHLYKDQIDAGYHKQDILDCYDYYTPKYAFRSDFPSKEFKSIDKLLFDQFFSIQKYEKLLQKCSEHPEYWRNWKQVLIADWYRRNLRTEDAGKILTGDKISRPINNEWLFSEVRLLAKKDPKYIDLLPWKKQREYLENETNWKR